MHGDPNVSDQNGEPERNLAHTFESRSEADIKPRKSSVQSGDSQRRSTGSSPVEASTGHVGNNDLVQSITAGDQPGSLANTDGANSVPSHTEREPSVAGSEESAGSGASLPAEALGKRYVYGNDHRLHDWMAELGDRLLYRNSETAEIENIKPLDAFPSSLKIMLLLFAARWCPICEDFGRRFGQLFVDMKASIDPEKVELIWVSSDLCEDGYFRYMAMLGKDALAVPFASSMIDKLPQHYAVEAVPALLVVDPLSGQVVTNRGRDDVVRHLSKGGAVGDATPVSPEPKSPSAASFGVGGGADESPSRVESKAPGNSPETAPHILFAHWETLLQRRRKENEKDGSPSRRNGTDQPA